MALDIFETKHVKISRSEWPAGTEFPRHLHADFNKIIFVERGKLSIKIWDENGVETEKIIENQTSVLVPYGHYRKITVLEDAVFFKFYWREK
jgi:hypothetical protein